MSLASNCKTKNTPTLFGVFFDCMIRWPVYMEIPLGKYKHFKGGEYKVIGVARHSETEEEFVVYRALKNNTLWVRPKKMFLETVNRDGKAMPRFEYIGN